ncbi:MAG: V-type ATPase subunit [Oscillospiraceae bacterium]|nr:V-type ATPase subunit [Oscillospiraceae bacterium]
MGGTQEYAVAAKVRAMYGKRLSAEDYQRIAALNGVGEIAGYLRVHTSYASAMEAASSDRIAVENAVRGRLLDEYFRILNFIGRDDMAIMRFLIASSELREIMRFIWLAEAGQSDRYVYDMPPHFTRYSKINYRLLGMASDYEGLLDALAGTPYHAALKSLAARPNGWPEFSKIEVAVRRTYFRWAMTVIDRGYKGERRRALRDAVGFEVDMVNIMTIFRIRRHFPKMEDDMAGYLLPVSYKLKPSVVKRMMAASDEAAMLDVLRGAGYARIFTGELLDEVEGYYYTGMIDFYRRRLRDGRPYVVTPLAYLFLKQLEIKNIIKLIECVQYGIPPQKAQTYLYRV